MLGGISPSLIFATNCILTIPSWGQIGLRSPKCKRRYLEKSLWADGYDLNMAWRFELSPARWRFSLGASVAFEVVVGRWVISLPRCPFWRKASCKNCPVLRVKGEWTDGGGGERREFNRSVAAVRNTFLLLICVACYRKNLKNPTSETVSQVKQENAKLLIQNKKLLDQLEKTSHQLISNSSSVASSHMGPNGRKGKQIPEKERYAATSKGCTVVCLRCI